MSKTNTHTLSVTHTHTLSLFFPYDQYEESTETEVASVGTISQLTKKVYQLTVLCHHLFFLVAVWSPIGDRNEENTEDPKPQQVACRHVKCTISFSSTTSTQHGRSTTKIKNTFPCEYCTRTCSRNDPSTIHSLTIGSMVTLHRIVVQAVGDDEGVEKSSTNIMDSQQNPKAYGRQSFPSIQSHAHPPSF